MKEINFDFSEKSQKRLLKALCSLKENESIKIVTPDAGFEIVERNQDQLIMRKTELTLKFHQIKIMSDIFCKVQF